MIPPFVVLAALAPYSVYWKGRLGIEMVERFPINPRLLRLPSGRATGADPAKMARQVARFGKSIHGMPPIWVTRGKDGELIINDGVTRATRVAKMLPDQQVSVEVIDEILNWDLSSFPTVGERLP